MGIRADTRIRYSAAGYKLTGAGAKIQQPDTVSSTENLAKFLVDGFFCRVLA